MALSLTTPWHYFADIPNGDLEAAALTALRTLMGTSYVSSPSDAVLTLALEQAVRRFEGATGRFFAAVTGSLDLPGNGAIRLFLPYPLVSSDQVSGTTFAIKYVADDDDIDDDQYGVNDGAWDGLGDPREAPWVERVTSSSTATSRSPEAEIRGAWSYGVRNIRITTTWGYLEPDGTTPALVRKAVARMVIRELADLDDCNDQDDLRKGAIIQESVTGRSWAVHTNAVGHGITTDREIDLVIRKFRRPPTVYISRPPRRNRRRNRRGYSLE